MNNTIEKIIENHNKNIYFQEELLNCVMYRIIERGGSRIGPRRAFIFAKEFNRNIDIPMIYAVDRFDPGLRFFINKYLKAGGTKELKCLDVYMYSKKNKKLNIVTIENLIKTELYDSLSIYTSEEREFHQKIVDILSNQINKNNLDKIKQLRIEN